MGFDTRTDPTSGETYLAVDVRGEEVLRDPFLNKGTAFSMEERDALGIRGLLPARVATIEDQIERVHDQLHLKKTDMGKNVYLNGLMDRNETLFYRFLCDNLEETVPIIYTPTVAQACSHWSRIFRRQHGVYFTPDDRGQIAEILASRAIMKPPVIVVTDNERILGIGDQGAGGMGIPIGKLSLYTAAAGIHPERCLPVSIDVGTNNAELLDDPLYVGYRKPRLRGAAYESLIDEFVDAVREVFPGALLQWEDFANTTSFRHLRKHRERIASFNDDIQGTAAMVIAGLITAMRYLGGSEDDFRIVIAGSGSAGFGISEQIQHLMIDAGASPEEAKSRVFVLDSRGLVLEGPNLSEQKAEMAKSYDDIAGWDVVQDPPSLLDVVRNVQPNVLIGATGRPGLFTEEIVTEMAKHTERPIIMPLSNPTSLTEVTPRAAIRWTDGRAIVATGSPFSPVEHDGVVHRIGQGNNSFIFPGMGLGIIAVGARQITDHMFVEAARALADLTPLELVEQGQIYPDIQDVRAVSRAVAIAVARTAIQDGVAEPTSGIAAKVDAEMWEPKYMPMRAVWPGPTHMG